ncbi:hypothetical protein [Puia dinghuensis]|uniref:Uncharacterized protein n=1 Tax=Puia dinghuensis TaxID=1792502 RepID=A0A8J2UGD0_9BACT|nr:hypothetical protein [Puia dinghuensis]GGB12073.1 hypothetical protein GCM10011511_39610 [Puia dinghuensis]
MKSIVLALLFAGVSLASLANGHNPIGDRSEKGAAEVKYIAANNGEFFFNVVYNNTTGSKFSVAILDESGDQIYQNFFSDKKFDKKFKLADPESFGKLTFIIRNYGDNSVQRFEVNSSNHLVEDVEVKEVK